MAFMTNSIAALAGPPALGAVITATGEYWQGMYSASSSAFWLWPPSQKSGGRTNNFFSLYVNSIISRYYCRYLLFNLLCWYGSGSKMACKDQRYMESVRQSGQNEGAIAFIQNVVQAY